MGAGRAPSNGQKMPSAGLLENKVAFVSGAGRGIGAAAARLFAREGARVVLAARTADQLASVVSDIVGDGGQAVSHVCDLADADSVRTAVGAAVDTFGCLDLAFNNGAMGTPQPGALDAVEVSELDQLYEVNFRGVWLAMAAEVSAMRRTSGSGAIVNTSSVGGWRGNPVLPAYSAMKRAVNSLTESAAVAYGPENIRVNAVAPGTTMTEMMRAWEADSPGVIDQLNERTPLRRAAQPAEVAEAAAWLLSDRASYVTGVVLSVDGGMHAAS